MRRAYLFLLLLFGNVFLFSQTTLDRAISEAAKELDTRIEPGTVVAIVNFNTTSEKMTSYVIEEMQRLMVKSSILKVVERRQVNIVTSELNFQMSGFVNEESVQGVGHMLGAESVITGSLELIGSVYRFRLQAVNVRSSQIQASYSVNVANDKTTAGLMGEDTDIPGLDYTSMERRLGFFVNMMPMFSIGSWMMKDYLGGILGAGIQLLGMGLMIGGMFYDFYSTDDHELSAGTSILLFSGMGVYLGGYIFNLIRPFTVHKKPPKLSNLSVENLGIALIPAEGGTKVLLSYKTSF